MTDSIIRHQTLQQYKSFNSNIMFPAEFCYNITVQHKDCSRGRKLPHGPQKHPGLLLTCQRLAPAEDPINQYQSKKFKSNE